MQNNTRVDPRLQMLEKRRDLLGNRRNKRIIRLVDKLDEQTRTTLHQNASNNNEESCLVLVEMTSIKNMLTPDSFGKNVWDYAQENNMENLKTALFTKFKNLQKEVFTRDMIDDYVAFYVAITTGHLRKVRKITNKYENAIFWLY